MASDELRKERLQFRYDWGFDTADICDYCAGGDLRLHCFGKWPHLRDGGAKHDEVRIANCAGNIQVCGIHNAELLAFLHTFRTAHEAFHAPSELALLQRQTE